MHNSSADHIDRVFTVFRKLHRLNRAVASCMLSFRFKKIGHGYFTERPLSLLGLRYTSVGASFSCGYDCKIEVFNFHNGVRFSPVLTIGDNVSINDRVHIAVTHNVTIGDDVLIGSDVYISDHSHGQTGEIADCAAPSSRVLYSKGAITIGDRVWIGSKVCILPGVSIGADCIIAAGAIVTRDIPPLSIAAGCPAKIVRRVEPNKAIRNPGEF